MRSVISKIFPFFVMVVVVAGATTAMANVASRYAGQVLLFNKRPPSRWANDGVFHRFVAAHKTLRLDEDEETKTWRAEYMAFSRGPINDREVTVRFLDAQSSSGQFITSYTLYLNNPSDRIVGGAVTLERPAFQPNRYYKITVASKGRTIARLNKFAVIGEEPERSGEVNFSDEDTRGP